MFFGPLSIAITSLGEERANLSAFHAFVLSALVWFCLFPLPLSVWKGLPFVIVTLPGLFSYLFLDKMPTLQKEAITDIKVYESTNIPLQDTLGTAGVCSCNCVALCLCVCVCGFKS